MMIMRRRRIIIVMIHTFSIALFPAERAPDEDDDKGTGSGDNRSTQKYHVCTFSIFFFFFFLSSAMLKQCVFKLIKIK